MIMDSCEGAKLTKPDKKVEEYLYKSQTWRVIKLPQIEW